MVGSAIAVIGAGFSGTLLSLHLLRQCPAEVRVLLIERNSRFGRGQAYAAGNPSHVLNVPAGRMSAFRGHPEHFLEWVRREGRSPDGAALSAGSFVPRQLYGDYIRSLLKEEIKRAPTKRLELIRGDVLGIDRTGRRLVLTLDRDRRLEADFAAIATGNFPPAPMPVADASFYDTPFIARTHGSRMRWPGLIQPRPCC